MSRKFGSFFSFSKRQGLIIFILLMIVLSINSFAAIYAEESSTDPKDSSQANSNSDNTNGTAASETQEQSSETDTNSTSTTQPDEEEQTSQNSTSSEPESQEGNSTSSSVSGSEETSQTSSSATALDNQTASSFSNSTETVEESASDDYQNINSTSTIASNSTTTSYIGQQQNNNSTVGPDNNGTTSNNSTGVTPSANNSTNYNNSTQIADNTITENSPNENATAIATVANNNSTTGQALNQNATTPATSHRAPDFTISVNPLTMSVNAGSTTTYSILVSSVNGFNSNVSLAITSSTIPGITTSLGSNITRPPVNASTTTILTVQSDAMTHSGKYKLKVTGSAANVTGTRAASVTLEVIGQNVTTASANDTLGLDAVALTPILIKDIEDNDVFKYYGGMPAEKMVFMSTTVVNNYNKTQPFILVMEIRDKSHQTLFIQLLRGILNPDGQLEFDISWMSGKAGTYEIRSFVIDHLPDPSPLSAVIGRTWSVVS